MRGSEAPGNRSLHFHLHFAESCASIRPESSNRSPVTRMTDHFRYDLLTQQALRGVVRSVLTEAAKKNDLPGDHHFYITFDTQAEGVRMSERLRVQYPEQMTIILQHQYWDLAVSERGFEVGLSFGGIPEKLGIPFAVSYRHLRAHETGRNLVCR